MKVGGSLVSFESEVRRLASEIDRVRERSEGAEEDWKANANRAEAEK